MLPPPPPLPLPPASYPLYSVGQQACRRLISILHIQEYSRFIRGILRAFFLPEASLPPAFPGAPDLLLRQIIENSLVPPHTSVHLGIFPEYFQRQRQHEASTEGDGDNEKRFLFYPISRPFAASLRMMPAFRFFNIPTPPAFRRFTVFIRTISGKAGRSVIRVIIPTV